MEEKFDLFEHYNLLPSAIIAILDRFAELDQTYENCAELKKELNHKGYDFEYGLDAAPYDLHKTKTN